MHLCPADRSTIVPFVSASSRSAPELGGEGAGGEYQLQKGFGWTNGVALDLLLDYGADKDFNIETLLKTDYLLPEMVSHREDRPARTDEWGWVSARMCFSSSISGSSCRSRCLGSVICRAQAAFVDVSPMLPPHSPHTVSRPPADNLDG